MTKPTNPVLPPPEREAFEREIHGLVSINGDMSAAARLLQKDQSAMSKAFNPYEDTRKNPVYELLLVLWAFDCIREGVSDEILSVMLREREKWLAGLPSKFADQAALTGNVGVQFSEFVEAKLKGKSFDEQIKEIVDVEVAAKQLKAALIAERNRQQFA
jgi:hypothetical protein